MAELESSLHLYQMPLYRAYNGGWKTGFLDAVTDCGGKVTWDASAVLSVLSFGYVCGDRTLVSEVKRRPWLSRIGSDNEPQLEEIPSHGRLSVSASQIAASLGDLLADEALRVCNKRTEVYVLLSGGLDSRIVAGTLAKLYNQGKLLFKPVCITWGLEDSRDVVYARAVADILGLGWKHLALDHEDVVYNTEQGALKIGALVSPTHLHKMHWFGNVSPGAIVLSGSYGDSIGRAEFSGHHLLELSLLRPVNPFDLICKRVVHEAYIGLFDDIETLHHRSGKQPSYVLCEHEMQGHYMRNMISHASRLIGEYCSIYQMFTHPDVYSYMWSLHPAFRTDEVYAQLLAQLDWRIARVPWARTNRALRGNTLGAKRGLRKKFHLYPRWISGKLFDGFREYVDPEWFAATGLFDADSIRNLVKEVVNGQNGEGPYGFSPYEKFVWLVSFRRLAEHIDNLVRHVGYTQSAQIRLDIGEISLPQERHKISRRSLRRLGSSYKLIKKCITPLANQYKVIRRKMLFQKALREFPPETISGG